MNLDIRNFFSTNAVKDRISKGALSEAQIFIYFYLIMMFDTVTFVQQWFSIAGKIPTMVDLANTWGLLIINGFGFIILFLANGGMKGKNFLNKYFSFSFTVGVKYFIVLIILQMLPTVVPALATPVYEIGVLFIGLNLIMLANIAFRIYEVR